MLIFQQQNAPEHQFLHHSLFKMKALLFLFIRHYVILMIFCLFTRSLAIFQKSGWQRVQKARSIDSAIFIRIRVRKFFKILLVNMYIVCTRLLSRLYLNNELVNTQTSQNLAFHTSWFRQGLSIRPNGLNFCSLTGFFFSDHFSKIDLITRLSAAKKSACLTLRIIFFNI